MQLFGKKKLSLNEILKGIEDLSDEDKEKVLVAMQAKNAPVEKMESPSVNEETVEGEHSSTEESTEVPVSETGEDVENATMPPNDEVTVGVEPIENESETAEEVDEEPAPAAETPMEAPQPGNGSTGGNYEELFAAQNAKIESLSSELSALKELVEKVVNNQDNQNFGYSPNAHFDENVSASRMDAVMQSYAPRRAEQYK